MIVYTVRGGVSAVIWTDVVQMFVYLAGRAAGVRGAAAADPRRMDRGRGRRRRAAGKFRLLESVAPIPRTVYTLWAGLIGGVALTLATHGTDQFLVQRLLSARSARDASLGLVLSGVRRLRAVHAVPRHRRDALHLLPARAAAGDWQRTDEILPRVRRALADRRRRRLHRRRHRRGGAVAVAQRDGGDDGERLLRRSCGPAPTRRR